MLSLCVGKRWLPTVTTSQMFFPRVFTLLGWSYKMYAWSLFSSYFQRNSLSSRVFLIERIPRDLQKSWLLLIWHFTSKNEVGKRSSHRAAKLSGFSYNATVLAGGTGTGLWITKLIEGINHKKWTQSKTDELLSKRPGGINTSELLP